MRTFTKTMLLLLTHALTKISKLLPSKEATRSVRNP